MNLTSWSHAQRFQVKQRGHEVQCNRNSILFQNNEFERFHNKYFRLASEKIMMFLLGIGLRMVWNSSYQGSLFYSLATGSGNARAVSVRQWEKTLDRRRYVCNVFSYWLISLWHSLRSYILSYLILAVRRRGGWGLGWWGMTSCHQKRFPQYFHELFAVKPNKWLSNRSRCQWFETS